MFQIGFLEILIIFIFGLIIIGPKRLPEVTKTIIKFILDGGPSKIGIESTVINLHGKIQLLRPGLIDRNQISKILHRKINFVKNAYIFSPRNVTVKPSSISSRILKPAIAFFDLVIKGF